MKYFVVAVVAFLFLSVYVCSQMIHSVFKTSVFVNIHFNERF